MAEIVLIQSHTGALDEFSVRLPEGILAVAAVPVQRGYDVSILDQRVNENFERRAREEIGPDTVLIGITAMTGEQIGLALEVTRFCKENWPNIPICWGGVHATLLPEQTAEHPDVDYVIAGDGDLVFCELFERLRDGEPVDDLRGLVYKTDAGIESNTGEVSLEFNAKNTGYKVVRTGGETDIIADMDSLPVFPYHLLDFDKYTLFESEDGRKSATLNTARGCPYRCSFCADPVLNDGKWRGHSPEKIIERLDVLHREYDVGWIYFQDDYFPGSRKRFVSILEAMTKYEGSVKWTTCGIRADNITRMSDDEIALLEPSGCHSLEIGVESGSPRMLKALNKAETVEQIREANLKLAQTDIQVKYTMIVGFPTETDEEMMETVRFAVELEQANPNAFSYVFAFTPIIGTPFFEDALLYGFTAPDSLEGWGKLDFQQWMRNYASWHPKKKIRLIEAISFTSYLHRSNGLYKIGGTTLLKVCARLYHPIAKWRFETQNFGFFIEWYIKDMIRSLRPVLNVGPRIVSAVKDLFRPGRTHFWKRAPRLSWAVSGELPNRRAVDE